MKIFFILIIIIFLSVFCFNFWLWLDLTFKKGLNLFLNLYFIIFYFVLFFFGLKYMDMPLWWFIFFISIIYFRNYIYFFLFAPLSFLQFILDVWWQKVGLYSLRYFLSSLSILYTELDLFWVEILRDVLYPNDNRYYRIYRRWVFWVHPRPFVEEHEYSYFFLFLWGFMARYLVMLLRVAFSFLISRIKYLFFKFCTTAIGSLTILIIFFLLIFLRKISQKIYESLWLVYISFRRQLYYFSGNFVTFELIEALNINWCDWYIRENVDEFEDPLIVFSKRPKHSFLRLFHLLFPFDRLLDKNGLAVLKESFRNYYFINKIIIIILLSIFFFFYLCLFIFYLFFNNFFSFSHFFFRKIYYRFFLSLAKNKNSIYFHSIFHSIYDVLIFIFSPLGYFFFNYLKKINYFIYILMGFFYFFTLGFRFLFYLPMITLLIIKNMFFIIKKIRAILLFIVVFLLFSQEQLSFFYFFSLGWLLDLALSFLDTFSLSLNKYYPLWSGPRILDFYCLPWIKEFSHALHLYHGYILNQIKDLARLRATWTVVGQRWKHWVFFIRFMPFYGQKSVIQKAWYEGIYFWIRTPLMLWWCYSSFDRLFRLCWALGFLFQFFIFFPHRIYQSWFYYVYWFVPAVYLKGVIFYTYLGWLIKELFFYSKYFLKIFFYYIFLFSKKLFYYIFCYIFYYIFYGFFLIFKKLMLIYFKFSWFYLFYIFFCFQEILELTFYKFSSYFWLVNLLLSDVLYTSIFESYNFFASWGRFYFIYGFFFNYLNYILGNFYEWWIDEPLVNIYNSFPLLWSLRLLIDKYAALEGSPLNFHMSILLRAERFMDTLCLNLQIPRDVQKQVYSFVARRALNIRFLLWVMPQRRTHMYATDRWLLPVYLYFLLIESVALEGEPAFNFPGILDTTLILWYIPHIYYGFIWNSYGIYYFFLLTFLILSKPFTSLILQQGKYKDWNREYAWSSFREQHPGNIPWFYFDVEVAFAFYEQVGVSNKLITKLYYYDKLLKHLTKNSFINGVIPYFYESSFMKIPAFREYAVYISPMFLEFYLEEKYEGFRSSINKGEDNFTFFSAYAYSLDPWINIVWQSPDNEDYPMVQPEVLYNDVRLKEHIGFYEKIFSLQWKVNKLIFSEKIGSWSFLKDPLNFRILQTSFEEDRQEFKEYKELASSIPDAYEFEDDEDYAYMAWGFYAWFLVVPFFLFYKSFTFLGGSSWHYNRYSPGTLQPYMLYFMSAFGHFEIIKYFRQISGDNYFLCKREASGRGVVMPMQYRPYIRNIFRCYFYDYRSPYYGINYNIKNSLILNLFYFYFQFLFFSSLEEVRFWNFGLVLALFFCLPFLFLDRPIFMKKIGTLGNLINKNSLYYSFSLKKKIKKIYLWFWR